MATHSSILAWEIPWTEELGGLQSMGVAKSQTQLSMHTWLFYIVVLVSAIQQCESATHTHTHIYICIYLYIQMHTYIHMYIYTHPPYWASLPPAPSHPSRSSQSTKLCSLFYSSFPLALCFKHGSVCMSILIPQFIPPSPSLPVTTNPSSTSVSLFLFLSITFIFIPWKSIPVNTAQVF